MSEIADRILGIMAAGTVNTTVFLMEKCSFISNVSLYDETMQFKRD